MKSKILSLILCVTLVAIAVASFASPAFSAEYTDPTIAVECSDIDKATNTFTADIVIYNNPGISGYYYALKFDNSKIRIVDVVRDEDDVPVSVFPAEATLNIDEPEIDPADCNELRVYTARAKANDKDGVLLSVIFEVAGDFGETFLYIEDEQFVDSYQDEVSFAIVNGSVGLPRIEGVSLDGATYVYDGTEKSLAVKGLASGMTVEYTPKTVRTVGTHKITATVKKAGYESRTLTAYLKITPKTLTLDGVKVDDKIFDNTTYATVNYGDAALVGVVGGDDVSFTRPTATFADANVGTGKAMVMDAIALTGAAAGNYTLTPPDIKGVIVKRVVTIVPDPGQLKKIGTPDPEFTYSVVGDLCGSYIIGRLGREPGEDAGEISKKYKFTIGTLETTAGANIELVVAEEYFTILNKDPQTVEVTAPSSAIYGTTGLKVGVVVWSGPEIPAITYTSSNKDVVTVDAKGNITIIGAGKAQITVVVAGDDKYAPFTVVKDIDIKGIPVIVTPTAGQTFVYGDPTPITYTASLDDVTFTGALALRSNKVGTQTVYLGTLVADNYEITLSQATVEIVPKTVTLTGVELWPTKTPQVNMNTFYPDVSGVLLGDDVRIFVGTAGIEKKGEDYLVTGITLGGADAANYKLSSKVEHTYTNDRAAADFIAKFIDDNASIVDTGSDMTVEDLIDQLLYNIILPSNTFIKDVTADIAGIIDADGNIHRLVDDTVVTFTFTVEVDGATSTFTKVLTLAASYNPDAFRVALEKSEVNEDGTFTVDVVVYNNPGFAGYQYGLKFDNSKIQIVDVVRDEEGIPLSAFPMEATLNIDESPDDISKYSELWADAARAKAWKKNGVLLTITFKFYEGVYSADLTLIDVFFAGEEYNRVPVYVENTTVSRPAPDFMGQCGDDVKYELFLSSGLLTIEGSGDMWDFSYASAPWYEAAGAIRTVEISEGVTGIGKWAFYNCVNLKRVSIPDGVTVIGDQAFYNCGSLAISTVPDSVTSIGYAAFACCNSIVSFDVGSGVKTIDKWAFTYCENLAKVTIPQSVSSIGDEVFRGCYSLVDIEVDENNTEYSDANGVLFDKNKNTLIKYPSARIGTEYLISNDISDICDVAFENCDQLTRVTFESRTVAIGTSAFTGCDNLDTIYCYRNSTADEYFGAEYTKKYMDIRTVTYNLNGGNGVFETQTGMEYESITLYSGIPAKTGYTFRGWFGSDGKTYNAGDVYSENAALTLTAVWEIKTYSITYNANGGENAPANATKEHFANYTVSSVVPTRTGYNFMRWLGSDGKTYNAGDVYSGNANLTLTAIWEAKSVTIIYDACGGEVSPASKTVKYEMSCGALAIPTRAGYTFDGWYTEKDGGELVTSATVVNTLDDFIVYAHWTANSYKVSFDANGGTISEREKTVTYDSVYGDLPTPVLVGFVFDGWYTEIDGGELVTSETVVKTAADHTLYAHFSGAEYLVIFEANGGECEKDSKTVIFGEKFGALPIPTRKGYTFITWSKTKTVSGAVNSETLYQSTSDTTLYAVWEVNTYKLTLDVLGGKLDVTETTVTFGSAYGDLPTPTKVNYIFGGWFFEKEYVNKITSDLIVTVADDHTAYAMWIPATFTVVYNANGGEGAPAEQTKNLDVDLVLSDVVPTRKGYKFLGWATSADGEAVYAPGATYSANANLALYAAWEKIAYGDLNSDGSINTKDAVRLAQYLAGWTITVDLSAADCNGDGDINAKDAVLLAQHLAGWSVTLG